MPAPTTQVPSALTDDAQLRRLDSWTREAIDERLRTLEEVQAALWRAAESLQRVRSTLPPVASSPPSAPPADEEGKGKGKARATDAPVGNIGISGLGVETEMDHYFAQAAETEDGRADE